MTRSAPPLPDPQPGTLSEPLSRGLWLYGLPGSGLGLRRSAGAPPLEELAAGRAGLAAWQAWIFYGPPDAALAELAGGGDSTTAEEELLDQWQREMALAVALKRQDRERLQLVNLGLSNPELEALLRRDLPELELEARRRRSSSLEAMPTEVLTLSTRALLQSRPALLNSYLDLEGWADRHGREADGSQWRQALDPVLLLRSLRHWDDHSDALGARDERLEQLVTDLARDREERDLLVRQVQQLEQELDHWVGEHEQLEELAARVTNAFKRAQRLLEQRA